LAGAIRLLVGLGNPGQEYERTRHNAGFWLLERFALQSGVALRKDGKYQALVGFFKIAPAEILVVHDELDFLPGTAKMKQGGGIAGHNGLRDISQRLGSHDYWRLRLGIGHPGDRGQVSDYVLGKPSAEDRSAIDEAIARSIEILPQCLSGDLQGAMQKLHSVEKKIEPKKAEPKAAPRVEKKPEPKVEAKPEPRPEPGPAPKPEAEKPKGLLGSLFRKK
jgi:PTH1 family peptidyl-tRNA hydrolase